MQINRPRRGRRSASSLARPRAMAKISKARRRGPTFTGFASTAKRAKAMAISAARREYARPGKLTLTATQRVWRDMEPPEEIEFTQGGTRTRIGEIIAPSQASYGSFSSGRNVKNGVIDMYPTVTTESARKRHVGDRNTETRRYITHFTTGVPSTTSVNQYGKLNGTSKIGIFDTQYSTSWNADSTLRPNLQIGAGFNQRQAVVYPDAHVTVGQIRGAYAASNWNHVQDKEQRVYGLMKRLYTKYRIVNTNRLLANSVTIKLYAPKSPTLKASQSIGRAFPASNAIFQANTPGDYLPTKYLMSGQVQTTGATSGLFDPRANLMMAPAFAQHFQYAKHWTKRLKPGEIWDWSMDHYLGSGVRLDKVWELAQDEPDALMSYLVVIEHNGIPVEAIKQGDTTRSMIGTSPSFLSVEFSNGYEAVLNAKPEYSTSDTIGGVYSSSVNTNQLQIKAYTVKDPGSSTTRKINYNTNQVGSKGQVNTAIYIPVTTESFTEYAGEND